MEFSMVNGEVVKWLQRDDALKYLHASSMEMLNAKQTVNSLAKVTTKKRASVSSHIPIHLEEIELIRQESCLSRSQTLLALVVRP